MMVHDFLEHRAAPARPGKSNRSWNIADSARRRCPIGYTSQDATSVPSVFRACEKIAVAQAFCDFSHALQGLLRDARRARHCPAPPHAHGADHV